MFDDQDEYEEEEDNIEDELNSEELDIKDNWDDEELKDISELDDEEFEIGKNDEDYVGLDFEDEKGDKKN